MIWFENILFTGTKVRIIYETAKKIYKIKCRNNIF